MKKFAVFDIDGTLIRWQLYHAVVNRLAADGALGGFHEQIDAARREWEDRALPFSEYERVLTHKFSSVLPRLNPERYEQVVRDIWGEYRHQTYTYTRDLIEKLRKRGYVLLVISGSPIEIIELLAEHYGFHDFAACIFVRGRDGRFTGRVDTPVLDKDQALRKLVVKNGLGWPGSIAVGDSGSDIAMLDAVEQPIAFNPDQKLFDAARAAGWRIVVERKNVVYQLSPSHSHCKNGCKDCKNGAYKEGGRYELD
jgi:HAD superfamily hydrolase (TIGR01490 family)